MGRCEPNKHDLRYYIGVFNSRTKEVRVHAAPKVEVVRCIHGHIVRDVNIEKRGEHLTFYEARVALGYEFGTKKAKNVLANQEINKVDHAAMNESISSEIMDQVTLNKDMPTSAQLGITMKEERPLPKYNITAPSAEQVYDRTDVIPAEEWEMLDISLWIKTKNVRTSSEFVNQRINRWLEDESNRHTHKLKLCRYIDYVVRFFREQATHRGKLPSVGAMQKVFGMAPQVVVEGLYNRFAERTTPGSKGGDDRYIVSPAHALKAMFYLAVCCLMVDNYDVDMLDLKNDLGLMPREYAQSRLAKSRKSANSAIRMADAFKQVGCKIRDLTAAQIASQKLTKAEAAQHKRAVLTIPLEFPAPPRRRVNSQKR